MTMDHYPLLRPDPSIPQLVDEATRLLFGEDSELHVYLSDFSQASTSTMGWRMNAVVSHIAMTLTAAGGTATPQVCDDGITESPCQERFSPTTTFHYRCTGHAPAHCYDANRTYMGDGNCP